METETFIDGYCERTGPEYWSEPINAVTNAAFLIAAYIMWRRCRGAGLPLATALIVILAAIGVGSYLFHTHAQPWAALADITPIGFFILVYLFAANRDYWNLSLWPALAVTSLFFPYAALTVPVFDALPFFDISAPYWPVALLILIYGVLLRRRSPETALGLVIGGGLLVLSLFFRSIDEPLCGVLPFGTHFVWHILNGVMLGWMIEVYRRHKVHETGARMPNPSG
ncbi:MAG: ceramidase domain-containing protein [Pseudomonadota bacterium]